MSANPFLPGVSLCVARYFVLYSDGELNYYSNGPKEGSGEQVPHYRWWKGKLLIAVLEDGALTAGPTW